MERVVLVLLALLWVEPLVPVRYCYFDELAVLSLLLSPWPWLSLVQVAQLVFVVAGDRADKAVLVSVPVVAAVGVVYLARCSGVVVPILA